MSTIIRPLTLALALVLIAFAMDWPKEAVAGEPTLKGRMVSPEGITIKNFPIAIVGQTSKGEARLTTSTDQHGVFKVGKLPPGKYKVYPANEPDLVRNVEIHEKEAPWYQKIMNSPKTNSVNLGDLEVNVMKKY